MFGFSVFLNDALDATKLAEMQAMVDAGFQGIFSSIHIPEDEASQLAERLQQLGRFAKLNHLELVIDLSGNALERIGLTFEDVQTLQAWGVTGLRMDYAIDHSTIAKLSQQLTVALNASTISPQDIVRLREEGAEFQQMEAWHNYYPRPETGLGSQDFHDKNRWLKQQGFQVMAFVPGDDSLRGPIFAGLPTLEKHRYMAPFAATMEMLNDEAIDKVYVGDPGLSGIQREKFDRWIHHGLISLTAQAVDEGDITLSQGMHTNRMDSARDVLRSSEARIRWQGKLIQPTLTRSRPLGTITVDNERYGRYAGELQITKRDLAADERVNVIGRVSEQDRVLIPTIGPGQAFELRWE